MNYLYSYDMVVVTITHCCGIQRWRRPSLLQALALPMGLPQTPSPPLYLSPSQSLQLWHVGAVVNGGWIGALVQPSGGKRASGKRNGKDNNKNKK